MAINVVGSLAMGLLAEYFALKAGLPQRARLFLTTGVLGGFTTFSAFFAGSGPALRARPDRSLRDVCRRLGGARDPRALCRLVHSAYARLIAAFVDNGRLHEWICA